MRSAWLACLSLSILCACDPGVRDLAVDLKSDFVPGLELLTVETRIVGEGVDETDVTTLDAGVELGRGARVAELSGLAPQSYEVVMRLTDPFGAELVTQRLQVDLSEGSQVATVLVTRSCLNVSCPRPGDPADARFCLGGECVTCPGGVCAIAECMADADCAPMDLCTEARCVEGACFYEAVPDRCGDGLVCDPVLGCVRSRIELSGLADAMGGGLCDLQERCGIVQKAGCRERNAARYQDETVAVLERLLAEGRVLYDPEAAAACVAELAEVDCAQPDLAEAGSCGIAVVGTTALGEPCTAAGECVRGATCLLSGDACPGTCVRVAGPGEPCSARAVRRRARLRRGRNVRAPAARRDVRRARGLRPGGDLHERHAGRSDPMRRERGAHDGRRGRAVRPRPGPRARLLRARPLLPGGRRRGADGPVCPALGVRRAVRARAPRSVPGHRLLRRHGRRVRPAADRGRAVRRALLRVRTGALVPRGDRHLSALLAARRGVHEQPRVLERAVQ